jgi:hypothetical protein
MTTRMRAACPCLRQDQQSCPRMRRIANRSARLSATQQGGTPRLDPFRSADNLSGCPVRLRLPWQPVRQSAFSGDA